MLALQKRSAEKGLTLSQLPVPVPGPADVLIRVRRSGICGTDLHIEAWDAWAQQTVTPPLILGHEFVGEVTQVGVGVLDVHVGDVVSAEGHLVCGRCRNCRAGRRHLCINSRGIGVHRDGAFAEYVVVPAGNVWVHPADIDLDVAAIFDPFGNAVHTALTFPSLGEDVLVTGAGPIGIMAAAVAKHAGARFVVITDVSPDRLELARAIGVDLAIDVRTESIMDAQRQLGMREGFDVGLEMSGHASAMAEMIANMTHGGRIAVLGIPASPVEIDFTTVVFSMLTIKGIYGREMFDTWYEMSVLLQSGLDISPVITHRFPAVDFQQAFDTARSGHSGKVLLNWD